VRVVVVAVAVVVAWWDSMDVCYVACFCQGWVWWYVSRVGWGKLVAKERLK
jgi:hypothetical protein